jgi:hypothetical protein
MKAKTVSQWLRFLSVVLAMSTCYSRSAQTDTHRVQNVVPVHGTWADGSGWKGVYDSVVKDGFSVSIVQEPETSFQDDVSATKRILALQGGPCILVATDMEERSIPKLGQICQSPDWCTSLPTSRTLEKAECSAGWYLSPNHLLHSHQSTLVRD